MLINMFVSPLNLGQIQLLFAIALDKIGYVELASKMSTVKPELDTELLAKYVKQYSDNPIKGFIKYCFNTKLFTKQTSRVYKTSSINATLLDLNPELIGEEDRLAAIITEISQKIPQQNYIAEFIKTETFLSTFRGYMMSKYKLDVRHKRNDLSDGVLKEILKYLYDYTIKYCCTNAYAFYSRTPQAYLLFIFITYFNKDILFQILNQRSLNESVGGDDEKDVVLYDVLTRYKEDDESVETNISFDFVTVCNKIYKASVSLFPDRSGGALYDIFSWYRDRQIEQIYKNNISFFKQSKNVSFLFTGNDTKDSSICQKSKLVNRIAICEVFCKHLIDSSISKRGISHLYDEVVQRSADTTVLKSDGSAKDGSSHYRGFNVNHEPVKGTKGRSNCDMFKEEYEGFLALKELIKFLESDNGFDLSVNNFNERIFREPLLLRRFHSMKEYVELQDVVFDLYDKEKQKEFENPYNEFGLSNNDTIYDFILNQAQDDLSLAKRVLTNLSLAEGVSLLSEKTPKEDLQFRVSEVLHIWENKKIMLPSRNVITQSMKDSPALLLYTFGKIILITQLYLTKEKDKYTKYSQISNFINYLTTFMKAIRSPLGTDGTFCFNYDSFCEFYKSNQDTEQYFQLVAKGYSELYSKQTGQNVTLSVENLVSLIDKIIYNIEAFTLLENKTFDRYTFRDMLLLFDLLYSIENCFKSKINFISEELNGNNVTKDNLYILYIRLLADNSNIFDLNQQIKLISDLGRLKDIKSEYFRIESQDISYCEILKSRDAHLIAGVNRFLKMYNSEFKFFKELHSDIEKNVIMTDGNHKPVTPHMKVLIGASEELFRSGRNVKVSNILTSWFDQDDYGYLLKNNQYLLLGADTYIHKFGYKVTVNKFSSSQYAIEELSKIDLTAIQP